MLKHNSSLKD